VAASIKGLIFSGALMLGGFPLSASATTVLIPAGPSGYGCTTCFGGPPALGSGPGDVVTLVNTGETGPLQLTLDAGTYTITNAATSGVYSGWRYDGGDDWAWNFVIGKDDGDDTATVIDVGSVGGGHYYTQAEVAGATDVPTYSFGNVLDPSGSTAGYEDHLTLSTRTTLDFFVVDGYLPDNVGGVALDISPTLAAPEPGSWLLLLCGVGMSGATLRAGRPWRAAQRNSLCAST
jgi:hypothetical protein